MRAPTSAIISLILACFSLALRENLLVNALGLLELSKVRYPKRPITNANREDKDDSRKSETPTPEVDEDGFCIRPKPDPWENEKGFYSSSDTDSEDERERKIRVEIKPLSNGGAPMSASVDELRATVENLSLSPAPTVSGYIQKNISYRMYDIF